MQIIADIKIQHKAELYEKLDAVIAAGYAGSAAHRRGVLVTRRDFDHFTVALSPTIPFGIIHEKDQARRRRFGE
ncbi:MULTISPECIES: hypothetical protein [Arthrobacter]|uniref:Uncharacterized protein n=1 Tax=Arthrobacter terricola TaxID=2547396 RepID=A0A4R5L192_9MICC|nr:MULTISPECIES: hypothetical protein [Arthrobacter]MBT8159594.1 hypothetical protein [Arthrobacter sp. GN70]TDG01286.1 hypothetical protein E1809_01840 [Arthrobacter terricola]